MSRHRRIIMNDGLYVLDGSTIVSAPAYFPGYSSPLPKPAPTFESDISGNESESENENENDNDNNNDNNNNNNNNNNNENENENDNDNDNVKGSDNMSNNSIISNQKEKQKSGSGSGSGSGSRSNKILSPLLDLEEEDEEDNQQKSPTCASTIHERKRILKKWGIPNLSDIPPEVELMERLVWVQYYTRSITGARKRNYYWWPAILYNSYREITQHATKVWYQLPLLKRMYFANLVVFDVHNPRNRTPVARLLGRPSLELVETIGKQPRTSKSNTSSSSTQSQYLEFYKEVPNILPQVACQGEHFRHDPELYYDWHVAMDQVEQLLRDCLGTPVSLTSDNMNTGHKYVIQQPNNNSSYTKSNNMTWLQRAKNAERLKWAESSAGRCLSCFCGTEPEEEEEVMKLNLKKTLRVY